ncbi:hypothetical protein OROMI_018219 [Orobanche minor]
MLNECSRRAMSCISLLQGQNSGKMTESAEPSFRGTVRTLLQLLIPTHKHLLFILKDISQVSEPKRFNG